MKFPIKSRASKNICLKNTVQYQKVTGDTWKTLIFIEKIIMPHNSKYYVKSLKRNKVKLSDIRGLWKKKKDV